MTVREGLLGLTVAAAGAGVAAAGPPVDPRVEGREPNPVAREFHEADPPTFAYAGAPEAPAAPAFGLWVAAAVWDAMLDWATVPLGTVRTEVWD